MNRERAETHLRLLAEAALRGAVRAAPVSAVRGFTDAGFERMTWVALALTSVHALDVETAEAIMAELADAVSARQRSGHGRLMVDRGSSLPHGPWRAPWFTWPGLDRQAGPSAQGRAGSGSTGQGRPARLLPLGLTVWYSGGGLEGELHLLSYSRTASGARFAVAWRMSSSAASRWYPLPSGLFQVTDDKGARYHLSFTPSGGPDQVGEIRLRPDPPDDVRWFVLTPPGAPALRVDVNPGTQPDITCARVRETGLSVGEHLLNQSAERLLVSDLRFPPGSRQRSGGPAAWLGDVVAALEAAEALSPVSPVPGRLAALCASLRVTGHGITASPARDLPEPWLSLLAHYHRRKPGPTPAWDGFAAVAAALPELNGIRLALLGLLTTGGNTVLYLRASDGDGAREPADHDIPLSVWVCDSGGRWHAAELSYWYRDDREHVLTLHLVPPLTCFAAWIELLAAGPSAEVRARLPLRWGSGHD